jgi:hypothetical protein
MKWVDLVPIGRQNGILAYQSQLRGRQNGILAYQSQLREAAAREFCAAEYWRDGVMEY